jgi:cellulose synthase/poly-beta-1,6-N-acetylglucosamine synthase-like glycosyltransferase
LILLTLVIFSLKVSRAYTKNLRRSVKNAPRTERISARPSPGPAAQFPKVSVIVPAYNEAENIEDCAIAMRESTPLCGDNLEVLIVDDRSADDTKAIGSAIKTETGWGWTWRGRALQINS